MAAVFEEGGFGLGETTGADKGVVVGFGIVRWYPMPGVDQN